MVRRRACRRAGTRARLWLRRARGGPRLGAAQGRPRRLRAPLECHLSAQSRPQGDRDDPLGGTLQRPVRDRRRERRRVCGRARRGRHGRLSGCAAAPRRQARDHVGRILRSRAPPASRRDRRRWLRRGRARRRIQRARRGDGALRARRAIAARVRFVVGRAGRKADARGRHRDRDPRLAERSARHTRAISRSSCPTGAASPASRRCSGRSAARPTRRP